MFKYLKPIAPFLFIIILLGGCGLISHKTIKVDANYDGRVLTMRSGDKLQIALIGNPTTGYMWEVAPGSTSIMRLEGECSFSSATKALGSGGNLIFLFEAKDQGKGTVKLIYHRPWEKGIPPIKTFTVNVAVK